MLTNFFVGLIFESSEFIHMTKRSIIKSLFTYRNKRELKYSLFHPHCDLFRVSGQYFGSGPSLYQSTALRHSLVLHAQHYFYLSKPHSSEPSCTFFTLHHVISFEIGGVGWGWGDGVGTKLEEILCMYVCNLLVIRSNPWQSLVILVIPSDLW